MYINKPWPRLATRWRGQGLVSLQKSVVLSLRERKLRLAERDAYTRQVFAVLRGWPISSQNPREITSWKTGYRRAGPWANGVILTCCWELREGHVALPICVLYST